MSKSKKNTIDPENIIENYGADSARLFILSDSPPEKDVQWSDEGIASSFKFIQKLWTLNNKFMEEIKKNHQSDSDEKITKYTNLFIKKVTDNLNSFSYNIIIANLHEMYAFFNKEIHNGYTVKTIKENYNKILITMVPIIPHFASECLELNKFQLNGNWPSYDNKFLIEEKIKYVIQINGRKRSLIEFDRDTDEKVLLELVKKEKSLSKYFINTKIKNIIYVKNKLMNIIL